MTATQDKEFAQGRAVILGLLASAAKPNSTCPEIGPIVLAHITAKHNINSFPAFLAAPLGDDEKLATMIELSEGLVRHLSKKPHGLQGSVPGGQAHNPVTAPPERKPVTPQLPPPLPDTAYKLGTTTMAPAFGKRVTPSGDPPVNPLPNRDSILPEVKPEIVPTGSTFDTPPKGTPPTDRLTEIIREIVGPGGGITEARVREIIAAEMQELREDCQEACRQARLKSEAAANLVRRFQAHVKEFDPESPGVFEEQAKEVKAA